jgi:hypothetical protein
MSPFFQRRLCLLFTVALLCFGTIFQMLGLPITFGHLNSSSDPFESPVYEGFTLISSKPMVPPFLQRWVSITTTCSTYQLYLIAFFFRPPNSLL